MWNGRAVKRPHRKMQGRSGPFARLKPSISVHAESRRDDNRTRFVAKRLRTKREHGTKAQRGRPIDIRVFARKNRKDKIMVQVAAALLFAVAAGLGITV